MADEVTCYVDPDASGSADGTSWTDAYTSLNSAEAALFNATSGDLVSEDEWVNCLCRSSSSSADTTNTSIGGFTTDATRYISVSAESGDEAVKTGWDTSRYRLEGSNGSVIGIPEDYVRINGLQIKATNNGSTTHGIYSSASATDSDVRISNCRMLGVWGGSAAGENMGIRCQSGVFTLENNISTDFYHASLNGFGILTRNNTFTMSHNIAVGCVIGFRDSYGNGDPTNCVSFDNTDDFYGSATKTYCASDDGDGTNSVSPSGGDWDNEFADPANRDFTLLDSGNCYHGGTTIAGSDTDIDGDSWHVTTPSIGVDEYVAAAGLSIPIAHHHYSKNIGN